MINHEHPTPHLPSPGQNSQLQILLLSGGNVSLIEGGNITLPAHLLPNVFYRLRITSKTPGETRSERDDITFEDFRVAFAEFAKSVREHDPSRLIFTGDSLPRPSAWHQEKEGTWTTDREQDFRKMLRNLNPDPINAISIHAYGEDVERIGWSVRAAKLIKKPLFVGEFGVPGTGPEVETKFRHMLKIIEESPISLAALWVFDLPSQDADFNITAGNARAYQLKALSEANARVQKNN
jgi:hypothetical protein